MTKPKVILHSSTSIDGSLLGFEVDMNAHYNIVGNYRADVHLIGSNTAKTGLKMFCPQIPKEEADDFIKRVRDNSLPLWVIPDTKGQLKGLLHVLRRFELFRDMLIIISRNTSKEYVAYLKKRNYAFHVSGAKHPDYTKVIEFLSREHKAKKILTDTGRILNGILLNSGLVDEISLLFHPVIVGKKQYALLGDVAKNIKLRLIKNEVLTKDKIWLVYKVISKV